MVSARLAARTCNGRATGSQPKPPTEDKMQFNQTTCAACGAECNDHLTVNRDGPGLGPVVAVCESC